MNSATLTTFVLYLIAMMGIGYAAYRSTRNFSDYILGGRSLSPGVAALSAGASDMSGWLLLGLPGALYAGGLHEAWIAIGLLVGAFLNYLLVAPRLRVYTEVSKNSLTLSEFFSNRLRDESGVLRALVALVTLVFFVIYTASGMVAGGKLFHTTFALPYDDAVLIGGTVVVLYTLFGGFLAVCWTDVVQGLLMVAALVVVPVVAIIALGGVSPTFALVEKIRPGALNLFEGMTFMGVVSLLAWGLGYFGQPHILVRFMAIRRLKDVPHARTIGMLWMLVSLIGAVIVGLVAIPWIFSHEGGTLGDGEKVFMVLIQGLFNPWVAGVLLAAILAAIMSTIDSQLLVASSVVADDFYKRFFHRQASQKTLMLVGRLSVLAVSVVAILLALNPNSSVLGLVSYAWAGFGASFGPIVLLSLFWKGLRRQGAIAGILTGAITVILWKNLSGGLFDLYEILPGFLACTLISVVVSWLMKEQVDLERDAEFDLMLTKIQE